MRPIQRDIREFLGILIIGCHAITIFWQGNLSCPSVHTCLFFFVFNFSLWKYLSEFCSPCGDEDCRASPKWSSDVETPGQPSSLKLLQMLTQTLGKLTRETSGNAPAKLSFSSTRGHSCSAPKPYARPNPDAQARLPSFSHFLGSFVAA